jgi:hypothetical protein
MFPGKISRQDEVRKGREAEKSLCGFLGHINGLFCSRFAALKNLSQGGTQAKMQISGL